MAPGPLADIHTLTLGPSTASYADLLQGFGYDGVNRLITADLAAGQSQTYTYDGVGNRLSFAVAGATTTYSYPASSHRLTSLSGATSRSFTYDAAGSVTASAGITYVYDDRGRLKQAGATTYAVNGLGQRVRKANVSGEVLFAYDEAGRLLGEYDAAGNVIQETVWFGDLPVAVIKASGTLYYIWADHLGTPRIISDASNQIRWDWQQRDPFGGHAPEEDPSGAGAFAFNLRFPGQYYDSETGLHYNYFRDYDASIGRYIQSDPIGLAGGINTYGYVWGSPLAYVDPYGLFECWWMDVGNVEQCRPTGLKRQKPTDRYLTKQWKLGPDPNSPNIAASPNPPMPTPGVQMFWRTVFHEEGYWQVEMSCFVISTQVCRDECGKMYFNSGPRDLGKRWDRGENYHDKSYGDWTTVNAPTGPWDLDVDRRRRRR